MSNFTDPKDEYIYTDISLAELAKKWEGKKGCSLRQLAHRSSVERWVALRQRFLIKSALKTEERIGETVAQMNERHLLDALNLRDKVAAALERGEIENATEAAKPLKVAIELERQARGQGPPGEVPVIHVHYNGHEVVSKEDEPPQQSGAENGKS